MRYLKRERRDCAVVSEKAAIAGGSKSLTLGDYYELWLGGYLCSVATWMPIQVIFHSERILGDGGLGGFSFLVLLLVFVTLWVVGPRKIGRVCQRFSKDSRKPF